MAARSQNGQGVFLSRKWMRVAMSDDDKRVKLDGEGFSKEEFTPEELSQQRQMKYHYQNHFLGIDAFLTESGLKWIADFGKIFRNWKLLLIMAGIAVFVGGDSFLSSVVALLEGMQP
jgi:hypothetical protein